MACKRKSISPEIVNGTRTTGNNDGASEDSKKDYPKSVIESS
jgi:hypothetical protein